MTMDEPTACVQAIWRAGGDRPAGLRPRRSSIASSRAVDVETGPGRSRLRGLPLNASRQLRSWLQARPCQPWRAEMRSPALVIRTGAREARESTEPRAPQLRAGSSKL